MNIQAVLFDADGVVVHPQMQFSRHLREMYGISPEMTKPFFDGAFSDCLAGKADLKDVLPAFLKDWGWKASIDEFIQTWLLKDHVVDARLAEVIQRLRRRGLTCCLATSQEHNRAEYMKREMGFRDLFDHLFFSCEIGWQKPERAYYEYIQKTLALEKNSILFWDDARRNVEAARQFGWNAEIYTEFGEFEKTIRKYIPLENRG